MKLGQRKYEAPPSRIADMYEERIIEGLCNGSKVHEIAMELHLNDYNVEQYLSIYRKKYGARTNAQMIFNLLKKAA